MNAIEINISEIKKRIVIVCKRMGRYSNEIKLLLATKTVSTENIKMAIACGETLIGENKVQELKEKYDDLKHVKHTKHFIGHLQSNKIKDILKCEVSCIQSIDRIDIGEKLHQRLLLENKTLDIFIQVNTSNEASKFGVSPEEVESLVRAVASLSTLKIKGLMTIGLFSAETDKVRACFQLLKKIQQQLIALNIKNVALNELSMGMSGDLEIAIEEGATIIRVGTAVFGKRIYPDSYYWNENQPIL